MDINYIVNRSLAEKEHTNKSVLPLEFIATIAPVAGTVISRVYDYEANQYFIQYLIDRPIIDYALFFSYSLATLKLLIKIKDHDGINSPQQSEDSDVMQ